MGGAAEAAAVATAGNGAAAADPAGSEDTKPKIVTSPTANISSLNRRVVWIQAMLLCLVNLVNYMDRFTVSGVLDDVAKDFNFTQEAWKGGLLQTAFIICYLASAPVFGYLGDRYSRKYLMILGILAWSACSFASSFMQDYVSFLVIRAAVGFGEAGFTTIAPTLLGDMFTGQTLTIVLALFYISIPAGSGLGFMIGSQIANIAGDWRWGVRTTPILTSVALLLIIVFLKDYPRGSHAQYEVNLSGMSAKDKLRSYGDDLTYLLKNRSFVLTTLGFTFLSFCTGALSWWGPHVITYGLQWRQEDGSAQPSDPAVQNVSFLFGLILCVTGLLGLALGSGLSYVLRPRVKWIDPVLCGGGLLLSSPLIFTAIYTCKTDFFTALIILIVGEIFLNMNWAIVVDITMYVVVPTRRSSAEAFQLMAAHAIGEAGAPYLIGLITDKFKESYAGSNSTSQPWLPMSQAERDYLSLRNGFYVTIGAEFLAAIIFLISTLYVTKDWAKAEKEEQDLARAKTSRVDLQSDCHI